MSLPVNLYFPTEACYSNQDTAKNEMNYQFQQNIQTQPVLP